MADDSPLKPADLPRLLAERASGSRAYEVTFRVTGTVTFKVRADSPEQAERKAEDLFHEGCQATQDDLELLGGMRVQEVPQTTLQELLQEPRDDADEPS